METLLPYTLFGSGTAFGVAVCLLILVMFVLEWEESGFELLAALGTFVGLNFFWGSFPMMEYITWSSVGIYLFLGFMYASIRVLWLRRRVWHSDIDRAWYIGYRMKDDIARWWLAFPLSLPVWVVKDLITVAWEAVYKIIGRFFTALAGGLDKQSL